MFPPRSGPPAYYDKRSSKEFHKYYEPLRELKLRSLPWTDLHDDEAVARHKPVSSPDAALTAFCQLAAFKLNAQRAMIFLFDTDYAYVLAEATKSLSLRDHTSFGTGDGLWLGYTKIPRGFSVCEHTVNLPSNSGGNSKADTADYVHIINDLTGDMRFCNRPFVTDGPRLRFYAGVPITTAEGINIGALCALDDKPRDGSSTPEVELLVDLAAAIMRHLEAVRAQAEHQRASTMLASLTAFVDDSSTMREEGWATQEVPPRKAQSVPDTTARGDMASAPSPPTASPNIDQENSSDVGPIKESLSLGLEATAVQSEQSGNTGGSGAPGPESVPSFQPDKPREESDMQGGVKGIFQLAADTLQRALQVDGMIFLDASTSSFDISNSFVLSQQVARPSSSDTDTANEDVGGDLTSEQVRTLASIEDSPCPFLAVACSRGCQPPATLQIGRRFLKSLTRRYKQGKIWRLSTDDDLSEESLSAASSSSQHADSAKLGAFENAPSRHCRKVEHAATIQSLLPDAKSIMFLPVWNHGSGRWCSGAIAYTCSSVRSFSAEVELQFTRAFCDVIVAELGRLDAQYILRSKSTFVSSISHELRTPLHGILGTVDYLKEQDRDAAMTHMISQIEICGQTMLDTINHVLDFAHVDQLVQRHISSSDDAASSSKVSKATIRASQPLHGTLRAQPKSSLDRTSEDVIDSVVYSFYCSQSRELQENPHKVTIILEIDDSTSSDWSSRIPTGAWNRICTNLVINAMKFTSEGYIHISLTRQPPTETGGVAFAVLTVADTGCGISEQFMQSSLFQPFEQENSVSDGTGLGMSTVARILKAIGGHITVESAQRSGTKVVVSVPLAQNQIQMLATVDSHDGAVDDRADSRIVAEFVGESWKNADTSYGRGRQILRTVITHAIAKMSLQLSPYLKSQPQIHLDVLSEVDLTSRVSVKGSHVADAHSTAPHEALSRSCIIVCKNIETMRRCERAVAKLPDPRAPHTEFVIEPCGPAQMAKALISCVRTSAPTLDIPPTRSTGKKVSKRSKRPPQVFEWGSRSWRSNAPLTPRTPDHDAPRAPDKPSPPDERSDYSSLNIPKAKAPAASQEVERIPSHVPIDYHEDPLPEPLPTPTEITVASSPEHPPTAEPTPFRRSKSDTVMLLVDDNEINMRLLTMYADRQGFRKLQAENGLRAVELYRAALAADTAVLNPEPLSQQLVPEEPLSELPTVSIISTSQPLPPPILLKRPQIILMDISMPVLDGFAATRRIRALEAAATTATLVGNSQTPHPPAPPPRAFIIALTGLGSIDAQREAFASGMDLFMTKPVRFKEVTKVLEQRGWG